MPVINSIVGDAVYYLDPAPANIQRRQEIRAKGVEILNKLHASQEYQRIILVGHSLGSVIGYDMLTYAWPSYASQVDPQKRHPILTSSKSPSPIVHMTCQPTKVNSVNYSRASGKWLSVARD